MFTQFNYSEFSKRSIKIKSKIHTAPGVTRCRIQHVHVRPTCWTSDYHVLTKRYFFSSYNIWSSYFLWQLPKCMALRRPLISWLVQCGWFCSASKNNNKSRSAYTIYFKIGLRALVHQNIRFGADPRIAFLPSSYMYRYKYNSVFRTHPKYANVEIYM